MWKLNTLRWSKGHMWNSWLILKSTHLVHLCTPHQVGTPLENSGTPWGLRYTRLTSTDVDNASRKVSLAPHSLLAILSWGTADMGNIFKEKLINFCGQPETFHNACDPFYLTGSQSIECMHSNRIVALLSVNLGLWRVISCDEVMPSFGECMNSTQ